MTLRAVTFDFHNTLASCDAWFLLEIRDLVPQVLEWHSRTHGVAYPDDIRERAVAVYRDLRLEIIHHGEEQDALECTMHVLRQLDIPIDRAVADEGIHTVMRGALATSVPGPGVVDAIERLAAHEVQLGVVSSAVFHPFLEWSLEKYGIRCHFESVITSASAGYYKSRTEIYALALDTLGVTPEETVHVGDSYRWDVQTARKLGIGTVWLNTGEREEIGDEADVVVESLEGVASVILERFGDR